MDIGLGSDFSIDDLRAAFAKVLPGCWIDVVETIGDASNAACDVLVIRSTNASEFPTGVSVNAKLQPGRDYEAWLREIARCLSETLATRTIFDGSPYGDTGAPYWSLVWDSGAPFLADDHETVFADGAGGPVQIIRPLPLNLFAARAELSEAVARTIDRDAEQ